jgi:hypothetical protein
MRALKPALDPQNISIPERYCRRCRACIDNAYRAANYATANYACRYFKGMAMWWFNKGKRKEIWDENIQWPIGDIQAAHKIREICRSAADSAEKAGGFADRSDNKENKYEAERYERAAKAAMEIAIKISDDLLRDSSVRQIVSLCVKANDLRTARILFRAIQAESIRQDVLNDHPILRQSTTG